jgi:hypothetical protein
MEQKTEKRAVILQPQRMRLAEYERQEWVVTAELGTTKKDVLDPQYWAHMSELMKPYDHIEVRIDDGSWLMKLLVKECDRNWAKVIELEFYDLEVKDEKTVVNSKYRVEWKGPHHKWAVIRESDSEILKASFTDKHQANAWMMEHEKIAA